MGPLKPVSVTAIFPGSMEESCSHDYRMNPEGNKARGRESKRALVPTITAALNTSHPWTPCL